MDEKLKEAFDAKFPSGSETGILREALFEIFKAGALMEADEPEFSWTPLDSLKQAAEDLACTCRRLQHLVNEGTDEEADRFEGDLGHLELALASVAVPAPR